MIGLELELPCEGLVVVTYCSYSSRSLSCCSMRALATRHLVRSGLKEETRSFSWPDLRPNNHNHNHIISIAPITGRPWVHYK